MILGDSHSVGLFGASWVDSLLKRDPNLFVNNFAYNGTMSTHILHVLKDVHSSAFQTLNAKYG